MHDCLFCRIISGQESSYTIWEDDTHLAFLNIYPLHAGHTLLIPKKHTDYFWNMPQSAFATSTTTAHRLARHLKTKTHADKIYLKLIGEDIPHVHFHLIPTAFHPYPPKALPQIHQALKTDSLPA